MVIGLISRWKAAPADSGRWALWTADGRLAHVFPDRCSVSEIAAYFRALGMRVDMALRVVGDPGSEGAEEGAPSRLGH